MNMLRREEGLLNKEELRCLKLQQIGVRFLLFPVLLSLPNNSTTAQGVYNIDK